MSAPTFCQYYNQSICRSCEWLEYSLDEQLERKQRALAEKFAHWDSVPLEAPARSSDRAFRHRAKLSVTGSEALPIVGLLGESDLDRGRELLECPIHHPRLNEVIRALPEFIRTYRLTPYRISERTGELKGVIAFYSPESEEMYLRWVLRSQECVSRLRKALPELQVRFPFLVSVSANIQPIPHAILEGDQEIFLTERTSIRHRMGAVDLALAPQAFVQTNSEVARQLYETAASWIADRPAERMLELYCGQGAFSFFAAHSARSILGIEINADAVRVANETAVSRGYSHLKFVASDATQVEQEAVDYQPDLILVNPPRRGIGQGVETLRKVQPARLFYSSCSVDSLAFDLERVRDLYRIRRARIFDLFPHTAHLEILVELERRADSVR